MKYKISCGFGEILDKITILKIKSEKIKDKIALKNINHELKTLEDENPLKEEELFNDLLKINNKLWILEDLIREKSSKQQFDNQYINIAESIHKTNDERCRIKKMINLKYNSDIIEEKSYKQIPDYNDKQKLEEGKQLYSMGQYKKSNIILSNLYKKFIDYTTNDNFYVDLQFAYNNIIRIFNIESKINNEKIKSIMEDIDNLMISMELKEYCKSQYTSFCLYNKYYNNPYLNYINYIQGPNINYNNMSFFKENDTEKTLLIYEGGGIGDKFMFGRFIPFLCDKYKKNNIIFLVEKNVHWFFNDCFKEIKNIKILHSPLWIGKYDYHCSLISLMKYLDIEYKDIHFTPLFKNINYKCEHLQIIDKIKKNKTYILNWKGNKKNTHEKYNRCLELSKAIPLFKLPNIKWIVITKDITKTEKNILKKYDVDYYGDILDNGEKCYEDSISILKNVEGVFSTDTSLVHLSANLDIKTYVLLTLGCEWRWVTHDEYTRWYPNVTLLKQKTFGDWESVIKNIINLFKDSLF